MLSKYTMSYRKCTDVDLIIGIVEHGSLLANISWIKTKAKLSIHSEFRRSWFNDINDNTNNPITRTYKLFKFGFGLEAYLSKVSNRKYRQALTRLRTSSHALRIESARHEHDIPLIEDRLCSNCNEIEDEIHFMISCPLYDIERMKLFENIGLSDNIIQNYSHVDQFIYLLSLTNQRHLEELARF